MKQEYLLIDNEQLKAAQALSFDAIEKTIFEIPKKDAHILTFYLKGENEDTAKVLSNVHEEISKNPKNLILANGCSEYFAKTLFPNINDFEIKLRKLLYLASSLNDETNTTGKRLIKDLELKDLGQIFVILFTDKEFNKNIFNEFGDVKSPRQFRRNELLSIVDKYKEEILWDKMLGDRVPLLNEKYSEIKKARNDVAHANNIDFAQYFEYKSLFKGVNSQLDIAIQSFAKQSDGTAELKDFNETLGTAIDYYNFSTINSEFFDYMKNRKNTSLLQLAESMKHMTNSVNLQLKPLAEALVLLANQFQVSDFEESYLNVSPKVKEATALSEDSKENITSENSNENQDEINERVASVDDEDVKKNKD